MKKLILGVAALSMFGVCSADALTGKGNGSAETRPEGFIFYGGHLTVKPYVSLSYMYDSNIDTSHKDSADNIFCVNPGANFTWQEDRWALTGGAWYRYNAYCKYNDRLGENSYGEDLAYTWSNIGEDRRGWALKLNERYAMISQSDGINSGDSRGVWRDRQKLDVSGVLERRFTDRLHADVMGQYNWLDYKNDTGKYAPLYGWSQRGVQVEAGWVASPLTDLLIAGGYTDYTQKKGRGRSNISTDSSVWTVQAGLGSFMTEQITYRALAGVSQLSYGGRHNTDAGWTYQLSANWQATRQLKFSLLGNSYYQPSERSLGQAIKVYALSGGVSYLTLGDKVALHADISYRLENTVYNDRYLTHGNDYDETILSVRFGADWFLNHWTSLYTNFMWEENWCEDYGRYDYDRFRFTVGVRFHY